MSNHESQDSGRGCCNRSNPAAKNSKPGGCCSKQQVEANSTTSLDRPTSLPADHCQDDTVPTTTAATSHGGSGNSCDTSAADDCCSSPTRHQEAHSHRLSVKNKSKESCCSDGGCSGTDEKDTHHHGNSHVAGEHGEDGCCSKSVKKVKTECCPINEKCVCDEGCQANYASLLHQQSGCKRSSFVPSFSSEYPLVDNKISPITNKKRRLSCAHCLKSAKVMSMSLTSGARSCYCKLTRTLCDSVKSLATVEYSSGCCRVEEIRNERIHDSHSAADCLHYAEENDLDEKDSKTNEYEGPAKPEDLEAGPQFSRHLALGIAGMHCSTCADDVAKILCQTVGVDTEAVQVSFVLSRGELKFDPSIIQDVQKDIISRVAKRFPRLDIVVLFNSEVSDRSDGSMKVRIRSSNGQAGSMQKALDSKLGVTMVAVLSPEEVELSYDPDQIGIRTILGILREQDLFDGIELGDVPDGTIVAQKAEARHLKSIGIQTILAAILTIPCLALAWSGNTIKMNDVIRYGVECACATAVIMVAYRIYLDAFWNLVYGGAGGLFSRINMDVLVSCATGAAYIFSVAIFAVHISGKEFGDGPQEPFFETSCLLTTLILGGRWLTAAVRSWASKRLQTVGDGDLQVTDVRFYNEETEEETRFDANELQYGDIIIASQGEKVATDGLVVVGKAQVDESHLTGEPKPQSKSEGSYLLAGSKIVSGGVKFRVSKLTQENTISTIKGMVKLASQQKPRSQEIADRVAAVLTPIILLISIGIFIVWLLVCAFDRRNSWDKSAVVAATYAVATLAISCPCAIALAVPMVLVVASRIGITKGGFVFKNPAAVEKGRAVGKVIFDKTGTLTTGQLHVEHAWIFENGQWGEKVPGRVTSTLQILCKSSNHPVARAMYRFSRTQTESPLGSATDLSSGTEVKDIVSNGIEATIDGVVYRGGKLAFTAPDSKNDPTVQIYLNATQSVFTLSADSQLVAVFGLKDDKIRPEVPAVLQKLRERNIEIFIFSGDRSEAVFPIADELQIARSNVYANCYPEDKRARLENLKEHADGAKGSGQETFVGKLLPWSKKQSQTIVFVGDGTNDAIALAAADIGISLSQSTDMATNSADVAIISDSIIGLIGFLDLSKRINTCVSLNFAWAVGWNLFAILGASGAWVNVRIAPQWAGLGEIGSVLPVFLISALVGWGYRSGVDL